MYFDEKQQVDNDEIDLAQLFKNIWFHKFSLLVFIIFSVPISIMYSSGLEPTYKAETVFEKPSNNYTQGSTSLLNNIEGLGFLSALSGISTVGSGDSFVSELRSESFLKTVISNNSEIDSQKIKEFCPLPSKETSRFSLRSVLISLGLSENRAPSESQKTSLIVQCVNGMLEIDYDSYDSTKSSAYRLSIESKDPNFSANLANQIVEKYFNRHEQKRDKDFQNVKNYFSRVITEAQLEYTEANKLIQSFKIKNTLLMNINPLSTNNNSPVVKKDEMLVPPSPFVGELNREIANLSQLEKSLSELKQASLLLSNLTELDYEKIKTFVSSTNLQGVLSRTFITAIAKTNNLDAGAGVINQEIKKIVRGELESLKQQIQVLEEKIDKLEEHTMQLMNIENRFQELAVDVSKKKLIFEGLKDQLKEKILTTGLASVEQPVLLTEAVPPFSKASPNKKLIVALGVVLSMFLGISYILIRQSFLKRVYSLAQLQRISGFLSCYLIKYKQLKQMGERSDETLIGQSFFSHAMGMDKLGCIIDLSQKRHNNSLASEFSKTIANLLAKNNSKIVCLDTLTSKKPFSSSSQENFASDQSNLNVKENSGKHILSFNDEDGMIAAAEVSKIKSKYSEYDKIICALGTKIGDLTKFKFIEQCDFYILIGRSFGFDEQTYKKFSNTLWEKEKKCLGFFLID